MIVVRAQNVKKIQTYPNMWCGANLGGNMEMSRCHFSWQARCFVRVGGVEV